MRLPYCFCIDITPEGRLHIHGDFGAPTEDHQRLKEAKWKAWGKFKRYPQFQIWISPRPCDDGWAPYCMRNRRRVEKIIGQTFTLTRPLQREAEWTFSEIRRIMRRDQAARRGKCII